MVVLHVYKIASWLREMREKSMKNLFFFFLLSLIASHKGLDFTNKICSNERCRTGMNKHLNIYNFILITFFLSIPKQYECQVTKYPPMSIFLTLNVVGE